MKIKQTYKLSDAKAIAGDLIPFRAPHRSCSSRQLLREFRLAVGGVLYLEELGNFDPSRIRDVAREIRDGGPLPLAIVLDVDTGDRAGLDLSAYSGAMKSNVDALYYALAVALESGKLAIANDTRKDG